MKFLSAAISLISLAVAVAALTINTPSSLTECEPVLLEWSDGTAPYYLNAFLHYGADPSTTILNFGEINATEYTWTVDYASGTSLGLTVEDSTGTTAESAAVTVQSGTSTSCLSASGSAATSAASTTATTSATGSTESTSGSTTATSETSTTAGTSTTTTKTSSKSSSSTASSSASSSSSSSSSAALTSSAPMGVVAFLGAAIMVLVA
ncbi:hypothetical protein FISHEDRAFT_77761 [Fistulina hepatica ATCC 64428]|nr:hypothetical protein FISHEDRAFT_77761 [Fistulina hepatica ATCC 64428]